MDKTKAQERLTAIENEVTELKKIIAAPEKAIGRRLEFRTRYYFIGDAGMIMSAFDTIDQDSNFRFGMGNYFKTTGKAILHRDTLIAKQRIIDRIAELNDKDDWVADWEDWEQQKYTVTYGHSSQKLQVGCSTVCRYSPSNLYGATCTIVSVMEELEPEYKLLLGLK